MVFFALLRIGGVGGAPACCIQVPFICFAAIEMLTKTPWEQTEARLRGPRARNWSGRAPLFFPSRPFRRLQCRADENVQPFLLSLTETSLSLRLPENCSIVPVQRDSRRKRDEKRARTEPIGRVFSLALFHQNGTSTTCIQPRRWRQRSQEDCQDLARARAPPRRLGPRRRLRAPVEEPRSRR